MTARLNVLSRHVAGQCRPLLEAAAVSSAVGHDADFDVAVVGAGFAGLYCLHKLRKLGLRVRLFEKGQSVGGVWYWNQYPGAKCDIKSAQYCYSFDGELMQDWKWPQKYSQQADILKYLNHVADRFNLRSDIQLGTTVTACTWQDDDACWSVRLESDMKISARFVVMASGCLSERNWPAIPGLESFQGRALHTQDWPKEPVNFSGRRVGVIGTGSSGVQIIPKIAELAGHLTVFQRTPNYVVPARQSSTSPEDETAVKSNYRNYNLVTRFGTMLNQWDLHPEAPPIPRPPMFSDATPQKRKTTLDKSWETGGIGFLGTFLDLQSNMEANEFTSEYIKDRIREIVRDPVKAEALCPSHPLVCKRLCVNDDFYEAFDRSNVSVVDLRRTGGRIDEITRSGIRIGEDVYELDDLVCATGFDAMTGALLAVDIRGRGDLSLREAWADGPRTYLGLQCPGFPNLFTVTGPQSPTVFANCVAAIEQHVEWISDCIHHIHTSGKRSIEATSSGQESWISHCQEVSQRTLLGSSRCGGSWYTGGNIEGKPKVMLPYVGSFNYYKSKCDEEASEGYKGFFIK